MSAIEALRMARENGVRLSIEGTDLILDADREPASRVLETLRRHKAGIVALLSTAEGDWTAEDWRVFYDERPGIAEFDGGQTRSEAEVLAFECCIVEWLNRYPQHPTPAAVPGARSQIGTAMPSFPSGRRVMATPGCIPSAGTIGAKTGGQGPDGSSGAMGSRRRSPFR